MSEDVAELCGDDGIALWVLRYECVEECQAFMVQFFPVVGGFGDTFDQPAFLLDVWEQV